MNLLFILFISTLIKPGNFDKKILNFQKKFEIVERKFLKFSPYPAVKDAQPLFKNKKIKSNVKKISDTIKFNILAIRVGFQKEDPDDPYTTGNGWFDFSKKGNPDSIPFFSEPPHDKKYFETYLESLRAYLSSIGYGKIKLENFVVKPDKNDSFYILPHPMRYYGDPLYFEEGLVRLLIDALHLADLDESISFMDVDKNGIKDYKEGKKNVYIIFHAGSTWQSDLGDTPYDIATVTIPQGAIHYYTGENYVILNGGKDTVVSGIILPEQPSQDGLEVELQGLLFHEFFHDAFYATDLYGVNGLSSGVGSFCVMGTGGWNEVLSKDLNGEYRSVFGAIPSFPSAWMRMWIDYIVQVIPEKFFIPEEWSKDSILPLWGFSIYNGMVDTFIPYVEQKNFYTYEATEFSTDTINFLPDSIRFPKIIFIPIDDYEYYLIEYRNDFLVSNNQVKGFFKNGTLISPYGYWDFLLPGSGLLIWHIDEKTVIEHYFEVNSFPPYKGVDVVEADGIGDFDKWTESPETFYGSEFDLFFKGYKNEFSYKTFPSSKARSGGNTFIKVSNISERRRHKMEFNLENSFLKLHIRNYLPKYTIPLNGFLARKGNFVISLIGGFLNLNGDTVYFTDGLNKYFSAFFIFDTLSNLLNEIYLKPIIEKPFALADIDNDSIDEILYLKNKRLSLIKLNSNFDTLTYKNLPFFSSVPGVYDIDKDGIKEIFLVGEDYFLYSLSGKRLDSIISKTYAGSKSLYGVSFSENPEIIYFTGIDGILRVFDSSLNKLAEIFSPLHEITSLPSITADYDGDGYQEIMGIRGKDIIYFYDHLENKFYERKVEEEIRSLPCVFDSDGNGLPDFIFKTVNNVYSFNYLLALNSGFPLKVLSNLEDYYYSPILSTESDFIYLEKNRLNSFNKNEELNITVSNFGLKDMLFDKNGNLCLLLGTGEIKVFSYDVVPFYLTYGVNLERNFLFDRRFEYKSFDDKIYLIIYPSIIKNKSGFIRIFTKESGQLNLSFYTFSGHKIKDAKIYISDVKVERDIPYDFSFLTPGPYILKWSLGKRSGTFKFFVEK
ncbi:MAG: hypothetical protein ABDH37_04695 [Candidatus Hydrothermales bacterium]